ELLVLDEPTAHLPAGEAHEFWKALDRLDERFSPGILFVTHRPQEARSATRILCLARGQVAIQGPPDELLSRETLLENVGVQADVGVAAWHFVRGSMTET